MKIVLGAVALVVLTTPIAAHAQKLCPDGRYVSGDRCVLAPDGTYVGGKATLAPDGSYVGGRPKLTPNGRYVGAPQQEQGAFSPKPDARMRLCPDGTYVYGSRCKLMPNGQYVGEQ